MTAGNEQVTSPRRPPLAQRRKARRLLLQALYQWQISGGELYDIEAQFRAESPGKYDWDFFHEMFCAIPPRAAQLDELLAPHLDRQVKNLDPIEKALLRMGTYELAERLEVPYRVVINEAVELAKVFGATESHKYINGVLDKLARQLRAIEINAARG